MKRRTGLMAAMLAILLLFAGCAANKNNATSSDESMSERPQMAVEGSGEAAYDASYGLSASPEEVKQADDAQALYGGRKVIMTYDIRLETDGFDALIVALKERLTAMGGYVQNSYIDGKEPEFYGDSGRTATLSLRVPAEKAEAFFSDLKTMGNVQSEWVYTDDVTTAYFDKETRLSVLNTQLERLENILVQTDNLADVLALEEEIARVMLEIESLTGELRRYDALIEYSTVDVTVYETIYREGPAGAKSVGERIQAGFSDSLHGVGAFFVNAFVWLVSALPVLIVLGIIAAVVLICIRAARKRRRAHKDEAEKTEKLYEESKKQ